jgi:peptidoglycan/xylan/chitin deacetylase (PgdA/CDA1 family)
VISIHPAVFSAQMQALHEGSVRVVPLERIASEPNGVALTFDDGFSNFIEHAWPVLKRHGFPATVFAVTGHVGGINNWLTQPAGIPILPLMSWRDLATIAGEGVSIGAHTVTHPSLPALPAVEIDRELLESKVELEERLQVTVPTFSYPYGHWNSAVLESAKNHFTFCCTTELNYVDDRNNPWALPRIDAHYVRSMFWFHSMCGELGKAYIRARRSARGVRQLIG